MDLFVVIGWTTTRGRALAPPTRSTSPLTLLASPEIGTLVVGSQLCSLNLFQTTFGQIRGSIGSLGIIKQQIKVLFLKLLEQATLYPCASFSVWTVIEQWGGCGGSREVKCNPKKFSQVRVNSWGNSFSFHNELQHEHWAKCGRWSFQCHQDAFTTNSHDNQTLKNILKHNY